MNPWVLAWGGNEAEIREQLEGLYGGGWADGSPYGVVDGESQVMLDAFKFDCVFYVSSLREGVLREDCELCVWNHNISIVSDSNLALGVLHRFFRH